jgi:hypothetical protein
MRPADETGEHVRSRDAEKVSWLSCVREFTSVRFGSQWPVKASLNISNLTLDNPTHILPPYRKLFVPQ